MSHCVICMARPARPRSYTCSPDCARRRRNHLASARTGRRSGLTRVVAQEEAKAGRQKGWRDAALGKADPAEMFKDKKPVRRTSDPC